QTKGERIRAADRAKTESISRQASQTRRRVLAEFDASTPVAAAHILVVQNVEINDLSVTTLSIQNSGQAQNPGWRMLKYQPSRLSFGNIALVEADHGGWAYETDLHARDLSKRNRNGRRKLSSAECLTGNIQSATSSCQLFLRLFSCRPFSTTSGRAGHLRCRCWSRREFF